MNILQRIILAFRCRNKAFKQGYDAYKADGYQAKCHYDYVRNDEWVSWHDGWEAAHGEGK